MIKIGKDILRKIYKPRAKDSKKYDFGLLTVIGGSDLYSGSPAFAALAAFRAGADMVRIIAPKRAADIIASFSPNLAAYPLEGRWLEEKHLAVLLEMTESAADVSHGKSAVVIGGGLGRSPETQKTIVEYLKQGKAAAVIDADAIYAVGKNPEVISGKPYLITPHSYEFFILTGKKVAGRAEEEKIKVVKEEAGRLGTTILLKGATDIISDGKEVAINRIGSPYLTVGGTGDTLAGVAGALLARGISPFECGEAAVYINGLSGRRAAKKFAESLMATDLIEEIPNVLPKF